MPQVPMQKLNIIAPREYEEDILKFLQEKALMQVMDLEEEIKKILAKIPEEEKHDFDFLLAEVQFAIDFLEQHKIKEKQSFLKRLLAPAQALTPGQFSKIIRTFYFKDIVEKCKILEEKINVLLARKTKLQEESKLLWRWRKLDIPLDQIKETEKINIVGGSIPIKNFEEFRKKLAQVKLAHFKKIYLVENNVNLLIIYDKREIEKVKKILDKYEWQEVILPLRKGTPLQELKRIKGFLAEIRRELKVQKKKAQGLSVYIPKLKVIYDYLLWGRAHRQVQERIGNTAQTFVFSGWIKEKDYNELKERLRKVTRGNVEIFKIKPKKGETIPVVIENRPALKPFETVTTIYGLPLPQEIDPTPYLAPFFILFFGLCLSDAGYGIVVAALAWIVMTILRVPRENQGLFKILIYGGIITFIVGALLGGWFGIVLEELPSGFAWLSNALIQIRQLDPLKDPIKILILSLALGVVQVLVGIAINMFWKMKQKRYLEAILDSGLWLYFIIAIMFWAMAKMGVLPSSLQQLGLYAVLAGAGALVLTQGRKQKNILLKFGSGVMSLYNLVGYLSDVLSYSRLLALGLATAVIAMVVNLVAFLFKDMIPVVGWAVMVLIMIGGHLFNMTISGLGAFIHSARLQYVEFFSKFMEGGGERFEPFRHEHKYITIAKSK